jgi:lycopene cyclase domain-containing protein
MTYVTLALPFLGAAALVLVAAALACRPDRRWWLRTAVTLVTLLVLTVVFDNLMIAADLFRYEAGLVSGVRVGLAPLEDLAWPVAASWGLPALALLLRHEHRADRAPHHDRRHQEERA